MRLDGRQTGLTSPTPTICFLELTLSSLKPCSEKLLVYLTCDLCNFSTLSVMCARCEIKRHFRVFVRIAVVFNRALQRPPTLLW